MSDDNNEHSPNSDPNQNPFEEIFKMMFGGAAPGAPQEPSIGFGANINQNQNPLGLDPALLAGLMQQMQSMFGGGANHGAVAKNALRHNVPTPDPDIETEAEKLTSDAFRIAELWLGTVVADLPPAVDAKALSRLDWASGALPKWTEITAPLSARVGAGLARGMGEHLPAELKNALGGIDKMLAGMSGPLVAAQLGEGLAALSGSVLSGTESGFPLFGSTAVLVDSNIRGAAAELQVEVGELRIYLATRELAYLALFSRAPWLPGHIDTLMAKYVGLITVDEAKMDRLIANFDPQSLSQVTEDLQNGIFFAPPSTPDQRAALSSIETLLSVIAAWCERVTVSACKDLAKRDQIRDALRARSQQTSESEARFAAQIGLYPRPARIDDAIALLAFLESRGDTGKRDLVFSHLDMLPTEQDLDDPLGYEERHDQAWDTSSSLDEVLSQILSAANTETSAEAPEPASPAPSGNVAEGNPAEADTTGPDLPFGVDLSSASAQEAFMAGDFSEQSSAGTDPEQADSPAAEDSRTGDEPRTDED